MLLKIKLKRKSRVPLMKALKVNSSYIILKKIDLSFAGGDNFLKEYPTSAKVQIIERGTIKQAITYSLTLYASSSRIFEGGISNNPS